ncbi:bacillithiol biosynthesis cysteine-adding enzyme BshC [Deinococcus cavernae]|uniref:Putative cysteine ligase BshC n=1 Tax=Deinococcus cavernae TaxID=2320857 RepID=A0A418V647_9DEIO|nr:bacillithiol biosynthesis cysteine-adding enzyme BshC [Deinococcus cavernae]RJF71567.1 bacillithiol biosynthesis cysteine-adding enzyme BshC [Deinococcus cavernae]
MARNVAAEYRKGHLSEFIRLSLQGGLQTALTEARPDIDRAALAEALRTYHRDLGTLNKTLEDGLERLTRPASRVVVTGQQAGFLTGPAYSVHKAADAILLARDLDTEEAPVLPIFWVASQDHDADEVASTTLLDMNEELHHLSVDIPHGLPIGRVPWCAGCNHQVRKFLKDFAAPAEHKAAVGQRLLNAAKAGGSFADVFARLVHDLLGPHGLIVLDPLHPALARLMTPALARELQNPLKSSELIEDAAGRLHEQGFHPQLRRPAGATNLFIEEEGHHRRLLRFDGAQFSTDTRTYTREDLESTLERDPSLLTPAAGLRPIVQDSLLPTAAFVVGPGEIAYAAQLRDIYPLHGLQQPLLWPRLSVTWLEPNVARLLRRFGVTAAQFQADPAGTLGRALASERKVGAMTLTELERVSEQLQHITGEIGGLDPTLVRAAERTRQRTTARVEHLQTLAAHALARAEDTKTGQLARLKKHLLPGGIPQEREMNFLTYLLKHGEKPLQMLLDLPAGFVGELEIP